MAALTHEKKGFEAFKSEMEKIGSAAQRIMDRLVFLIDEDTNAFNKVMDANRLPAESDEEQEAKAAAVIAAAKYAIDIPAEVAELSLKMMQLAGKLVEHGNPNSVSDAGVAAEVGAAAVNGACLNVLINLPGITAEVDYVTKMRRKVTQLTAEAAQLRTKIFVATQTVIEGK